MLMACSTRLEQAILQHDKQVEDVERIAAVEQIDSEPNKVCSYDGSGICRDLEIARHFLEHYSLFFGQCYFWLDVNLILSS